jgi:hypothetical protein
VLFRKVTFAVGHIVLDYDIEVGSMCPKLQKLPPM